MRRFPWWQLRNGLGHGKLEEANRPVKVLQPALPEFGQREGEFLFLILDEGLRRLGDEDLAAAGGGTDPGCAMDGQARIASLDRDRLAGVEEQAPPGDGSPPTGRPGPSPISGCSSPRPRHHGR
jgi:hypothetical protein